MKQSSLLNWSVFQDRRRWTENTMFFSQINSQVADKFCEICQWPFLSMKIQTSTKHLERCRKKKKTLKNNKECPSGALCRSNLESHYQLYSHDLLAEERRHGKPIKPDPVAKGTNSLCEVIDLTSNQLSPDEFKTSGSSSSCKTSSPLNKFKLLSPNSSRRAILTGQRTTPRRNRCGGKKLGTGSKIKGSPAFKTEKSISDTPWSIMKKQRKKLSATTSDCVDLTQGGSSDDDDDAVKSVTNCDGPSTSKLEDVANYGAKKRNITTKKEKLGVRRLSVLSSDGESGPEGPKRRKIERKIHHPNPKFKNPSGGFGSHLIKQEPNCLNHSTSTDDEGTSKFSETSSGDFCQNSNNKSSSYALPFVKLPLLTSEKPSTGALKQKKGLNCGHSLQDDIEIQSTQAQPSDKTKSSASALRDIVGNSHASTTPLKGPSFVPTSPILQENLADQEACLHSEEEDLFSVRSGDLIIDESHDSTFSDRNLDVCDLPDEDVCPKTILDGMDKQHQANKHSNVSTDNLSSLNKPANWLLDANNNSKVENKEAKVLEPYGSLSKSNGIQNKTNSDEIQHLDSSMSGNLLLPSPELVRIVRKDPCKKSDGLAASCSRKLHFDGMQGSKNDILSPHQSQLTSSKTKVNKSFLRPKTTVTNTAQHMQPDVGSPKISYPLRCGNRSESSGSSIMRTNQSEDQGADKSNIQQKSPKLKVRCNSQSGNSSTATATSSNTPSISTAVSRNSSYSENKKHPEVSKRKKQGDIGSMMFGMEPKLQERQASEGSMMDKIDNNSNHRANATGYTRKCPFYKKIAGTTIAVDAFSYGTVKGINFYFLSHFHSDHYMGLNKKTWKHKVYCGRVTGNLVVEKLKLSESLIVRLPMWEEIPLDNVRVTLLEANHCPGAVLFLFKLLNNRVILHTGDFRAQPEMENYAALQGIKVNTLHLDTTYLQPSYCFPLQRDAINAAVTIAMNCLRQCQKTLFVVGTYLIGKERIFKALAQAIGSKIFVATDKYRTIRCLEDSELSDLVTKTSDGCKVHVVPMRSLNMKDLKSHLAKHSYFKRMVAIKPTGWTHSTLNNSLDQIKPVESGQIKIYGLPYSEHSSFDDLRRFVQFLKPDRVIPTVNVGKKSSRDMMNIYLNSWKSGSDP